MLGWRHRGGSFRMRIVDGCEGHIDSWEVWRPDKSQWIDERFLRAGDWWQICDAGRVKWWDYFRMEEISLGSVFEFMQFLGSTYNNNVHGNCSLK